MALDFSNAGVPTSQVQGLNPQDLQASSASAEYSSSLVIQELTAPSGKQARVLTLQGPGLPYMGAEWGFSNNLKTTWYPGNGDEASQQNLGPMELPSQWSGSWHRTLLGTAPCYAQDDTGNQVTLVDPDSIATFMEEMLRGGARLRVTWSQSSGNPSNRGKRVREGRAKQFVAKITRIQDIEWDVSWEWQSRGQRVQTVTSVRDGGDDAAVAAAVIAATNLASAIADNQAIQSNSAIFNSASQFTLGQLESFANAPTAIATSLLRQVEQAQTAIEQVAEIAQTLESQPQNIAGALTNTVQNAIAVARQYVDTAGQQPAELMTNKTTVHDMLRAFSYFGGISDATYQAMLASQLVVLRIQAKAPTPAGAGTLDPHSAQAQQGDMLAVHVCKDGDTPQRVSLKYYGSMDHGLDILQANRLPWMQPSFNKGQVLFIPRLRTQQRRQ